MKPALEAYLAEVGTKMTKVSELLTLAIEIKVEHPGLDLLPILHAAEDLSKQCDDSLDSVTMRKAGVA